MSEDLDGVKLEAADGKLYFIQVRLHFKEHLDKSLWKDLKTLDTKQEKCPEKQTRCLSYISRHNKQCMSLKKSENVLI